MILPGGCGSVHKTAMQSLSGLVFWARAPRRGLEAEAGEALSPRGSVSPSQQQ